MGVLALEPHPRLAAPDSPPGLVSPSSSSYSSRPSPPAEKLWSSRFDPVSPPMSNYEHSSAADMAAAGSTANDAAGRKASTQSAPRQSLPSLSSIFGPARPLHSPMSDRPSGYPATSPLDRPHFSTSQGDRSYGASYFPPQDNSPGYQPRSTYESRYDHSRQTLNSLPRSLSGSGSPGYREPEHLRQDSRSDFGKWSMQHEAGKHEYSLASRESQQAPRGHFDRPSYQYSSPTDTGSSYRDQRPPSGSGMMQPSAPASATPSEVIPSKDGLGPKIWTGNQFLPRFVRAAEVPGEGLCYFYDDGSHCKTVIDGENVNALWGVTKAGKPRKRLAIACVTCREKKIKCDPDYPRCVQCEKFGRQCKFKNAPRGGHNTSPSTPPAEPEDMRRLGGPMASADMHRTGSASSAPVSPRTTLRQSSAEPPMPHKRMRLGYESYAPTMGEPMALSRAPDASRASISWQPHQPIALPRIHEDVLSRAWQADPYVSDPESISSVISSFFVHNDSTLALRFLPETAFKSWVSGNAHKKSPEDLMLIYSILAIGVALSGAPLTSAHEYAQVANYAQQRAAPGLQLVQARLLLALYYMATSRTTEACDITSAAISAAASLQLNLELDRSIESSLEVFPYGLKKAGYEESRRRTYWACYVLERLNGMFPNRPSTLDDNDIFIRLPCETKCFEEQQESDAPYFPGLPQGSGKSNRQLSLWAYLVQLVSKWAHVMSEAYRTAQGLRGDSATSEDSREQPDDWHEPHAERHLARGLDHWLESLPERFTYGRGNMDLAAQDGTLSTFLTIHLLYHHGMVKIHRNSQPPRRLSPALRLQYLERTREEATRVLDIVGALEALLQSRRTAISAPPPFMSHVILEAADVLTAEGSLEDVSVLLDRLAVATAVVEAASTIWEASRVHRVALEQRMGALQLLRDCQPGETPFAGGRTFVNEEQSELPTGRGWRIDNAMDATFPRTMDLVYARS
ncbi:fungal specific transcription factor [Colletotrichum plurivorum]|uniref:Fungal specific transcription factor n=1 Tax=Colletotrichum plurivorum TaxID=2175906 RepID=A0A8H6U6E9_9PEZI|nr:fungal specific transcription factor [Colletotrichum plurivorum]